MEKIKKFENLYKKIEDDIDSLEYLCDFTRYAEIWGWESALNKYDINPATDDESLYLYNVNCAVNSLQNKISDVVSDMEDLYDAMDSEEQACVQYVYNKVIDAYDDRVQDF